uniref:Uncharacterized protein n=1 Tax=Octopus bimaculoides TaxID=37653 RepID=A0A0L8H485_OCTBM
MMMFIQTFSMYENVNVNERKYTKMKTPLQKNSSIRFAKRPNIEIKFIHNKELQCI